MADFPILKTGAILQYPATATVRFFSRSLRFVDGADQFYRESKSPLREWVIRLELLDESEMKSLERFFTDQQGQFASFSFTDPKDGVTYPNCSLVIDDLVMSFDGETRGRTTMIIRENRD